MSRARPTPRTATPARPARSAYASPPAARARPIWSPALPPLYMDSIPMVAITGNVGTSLIGRDSLPGGLHRRHHHADHQAQLCRAPCGGACRYRAAMRFRIAAFRPSRPGSDRHSQGRHRRRVRVHPARARRKSNETYDDHRRAAPGRRGYDQRSPNAR